MRGPPVDDVLDVARSCQPKEGLWLILANLRSQRARCFLESDIADNVLPFRPMGVNIDGVLCSEA